MKKIIRFGFKYFLWFVPFWYGLSMLLTRRRGGSYAVRADYDRPGDIAKALRYGGSYKKDPISGALDVLSHPKLVQKRITNDVRIGDCDDHAMYWCVALLKSHLADRVWFSFVQMENNHTGKRSGHVVCMFERYGKLYWADYNEPKLTTEWAWAVAVARGYDAQPVAAATIEVALSGRGEPRFRTRKKRLRF